MTNSQAEDWRNLKMWMPQFRCERLSLELIEACVNSGPKFLIQVSS